MLCREYENKAGQQFHLGPQTGSTLAADRSPFHRCKGARRGLSRPRFEYQTLRFRARIPQNVDAIWGHPNALSAALNSVQGAIGAHETTVARCQRRTMSHPVQPACNRSRQPYPTCDVAQTAQIARSLLPEPHRFRWRQDDRAAESTVCGS